ncbi:MAG: oligopeptide/dipeptide ABC transporter ATP-binding protein [Pirellulales bacterium]
MSNLTPPSPSTTHAAKAATGTPVLEVRDLQVHFQKDGGLFQARRTIRAVDGVSFQVKAGETLGLVGESGCGKSTTARAIMRLVQPTAGQIFLDGARIDALSSSELFPIRKKMQMIFQDPFASLNPRMTAARIIREPMDILGLYTAEERPLEVLRLMELVGLSPHQMQKYPHEFSGGQRQRIGIARALAAQPKLIVCDEPVSALDVSIQAQVVNLLSELQEKLGLAYLFISHDLAVVRHLSQQIGVMYLGRLVELTTSDRLYQGPKHPYTQALFSSIPIADPVQEKERQGTILSGEVPSPDKVYPGCAFADRCPIAEAICKEKRPPLLGTVHQVACHKAEAV